MGRFQSPNEVEWQQIKVNDFLFYFRLWYWILLCGKQNSKANQTDLNKKNIYSLSDIIFWGNYTGKQHFCSTLIYLTDENIIAIFSGC